MTGVTTTGRTLGPDQLKTLLFAGFFVYILLSILLIQPFEDITQTIIWYRVL